MFEVWKDIPSYEGLYQASNLGNIRSLNYRRKGIVKILKQSKDHGGYLQVLLYKNGKQKIGRVNRLVYSAFYGSIPEGMEVNHINEVKTDNSIVNLNLMDRKTNMNWGSQKQRSSISRKNGKCSKKVVQYDLEGNFVCEFPSQQEASRQTGFNRGNISSCCCGKLPSVNGYIFTFSNKII